jgi:hypothetical protein
MPLRGAQTSKAYKKSGCTQQVQPLSYFVYLQSERKVADLYVSFFRLRAEFDIIVEFRK